jgi:DNA-binding NarL/FixJ family response regulator
VAALATSLFAVWRTRAMVHAAENRMKAAGRSVEATLRNWREILDSLSAQVRDLPQQGLPAATSSPPKSGLNMNKRSQVLRMHRRGDAPEQIAVALEVPLQEVDLLLKVQRIVLRNL